MRKGNRKMAAERHLERMRCNVWPPRRKVSWLYGRFRENAMAHAHRIAMCSLNDGRRSQQSTKIHFGPWIEGRGPNPACLLGIGYLKIVCN